MNPHPTEVPTTFRVCAKALCDKHAIAYVSPHYYCEEHNPKKLDEINHPKHYNSHPSKIEAITICEHHNFNIGNAIKYLFRQGLKDTEPAVKDLKKAAWYINREIERLEKENAKTKT